MKWTVKLVAEVHPGTLVEQEVITVEREDLNSPATVGLAIAESKAIMENLQQQIVAAQVQRCNVTAQVSSLVRDVGRHFPRRAIISPLFAASMAKFRCGFGA